MLRSFIQLAVLWAGSLAFPGLQPLTSCFGDVVCQQPSSSVAEVTARHASYTRREWLPPRSLLVSLPMLRVVSLQMPSFTDPALASLQVPIRRPQVNPSLRTSMSNYVMSQNSFCKVASTMMELWCNLIIKPSALEISRQSNLDMMETGFMLVTQRACFKNRL